MSSMLASLAQAYNLMSHHLDERTTELGIGTQEYLVLRLATLNPDASMAEVRRALAMRDAGFSDTVRRIIYRGYAVERAYPRDRRTRRIAVTLPGEQALRIVTSIHMELEAAIGMGPWRDETLERLVRIGRRLRDVPTAERYVDGLPLATT